MPQFLDQTGRQVFLSTLPQRIISLVPSQTELLYDLGLDHAIVGITKFCIHPDPWFRSKQRIGGTKNPNIRLIEKLNPDFIIGNKEENRKEDIEQLQMIAPTWLSDVNTLDGAIHMISQVGEMTGTQERALIIVQDIFTAFKNIRPLPARPRVAYLIWQEPFMAVASNTFIQDLLHRCGFQNVFEAQTRYPVVTESDLMNADCDFIFLSTEPYPFNEGHVTAINALIPSAKVMLVDGESFSWYGTRLLASTRYFQTLIDNLQYGTGTS